MSDIKNNKGVQVGDNNNMTNNFSSLFLGNYIKGNYYYLGDIKIPKSWVDIVESLLVGLVSGIVVNMVSGFLQTLGILSTSKGLINPMNVGEFVGSCLIVMYCGYITIKNDFLKKDILLFLMYLFFALLLLNILRHIRGPVELLVKSIFGYATETLNNNQIAYPMTFAIGCLLSTFIVRLLARLKQK